MVDFTDIEAEPPAIIHNEWGNFFVFCLFGIAWLITFTLSISEPNETFPIIMAIAIATLTIWRRITP